MTLVERHLEVIPPVVLRDVELWTKYLMGKNYHRSFVEPDLGPYECGAEGGQALGAGVSPLGESDKRGSGNSSAFWRCRLAMRFTPVATNP